MHTTPRQKRTTKSILLQWAVVMVFFIPAWLLYAWAVSPGLRPESRATLDIAVPAAVFAVCVGGSFAYRAWRRRKELELPSVP